MPRAIVIDNGSHTIKGGLAGSFEPQSIFPSQIACKSSGSDTNTTTINNNNTHVYAGDNVTKQLKLSTMYSSNNSGNNGSNNNKYHDDYLQVSRPLYDHENIDWDGLEHLWKHLLFDKPNLSQIQIDNMDSIRDSYEDSNLLLSSHLNDTLNYKSKLMELGYESLDVDGIYIQPTTTLGLYSVGKLTGTVVDSGYQNTFVSSIYQGYALPASSAHLPIGGVTIDHFVQKMLLQNRYNLEQLINKHHRQHAQQEQQQHTSTSANSSSIWNLNVTSMEKSLSLTECEKIKKQFCYCSKNYQEEDIMYKQKQDNKHIYHHGHGHGSSMHRVHHGHNHNNNNNNNNDKSTKSEKYELPDGCVLKIRHEKYRACELMFRPSIANINLHISTGTGNTTCRDGSNRSSFSNNNYYKNYQNNNNDGGGGEGIVEAVYQSISKCNHDLQREMLGNIVVTGGNTMMNGFAKRLKHGIHNYAQASMSVDVNASPQRLYAAFTGGSILASQDQMKDVWITKEMYQEMGEKAIIVRCF